MGVAALIHPGQATLTYPQCVLGIDPGLNTTGYGVLQLDGPRRFRMLEAGVIRSTAKATIESRLLELHRGITEVIQAHRPTVMAIEQLYSHYERPTTAILMGHARGVLCLAAAQAGITIHHYEANRVKKLLTGNGHSPKGQMQMAVRLQLQLPSVPEPPDVADALAIAICHCHLGGNPG